MRHIRQIQCKQKAVLGFTVYAKKGIANCNSFFKSDRRGSNPRPRPWQGRTLPTEPLSHILSCCSVLCVPQNNTYYTTRISFCQHFFEKSFLNFLIFANAYKTCNDKKMLLQNIFDYIHQIML